MNPSELAAWRKALRQELIARRMAVDPATLQAWRHALDARLAHAFPALEQSLIGFCWPFQNEYDARHLLARLRERGARTALPVVLAPKAPMIFRAWAPGDALAEGVYDIPYPSAGDPVLPDWLLVPMNGFDACGYRLGYGGGFFDRTLTAWPVRPRTIGVTFELARLATIHPQPYDIPLDYVATERALYARRDGSLVEIDRA